MVTLVSACVTTAPGVATPAPQPTGTSGPTATPGPTAEAAPTLSPGVNLVITNFEFVPDTIQAGASTEIRLSVKNIGSIASPPFSVGLGFTAAFGGGGAFKAIQDPNGILPGQQTDYAISRHVDSSDVYTVTAWADNDDQIREDNEEDNKATATLAITPPPPGPNLVISSFTITPASICAGNQVEFDYLVSNTGTEPASEFFLQLSWETTAGATGNYGGPFFEAPLNPGGTVTAGTTQQIDSAGEYTFTAAVDPDGNVTEQIETDNEATASLSVC